MSLRYFLRANRRKIGWFLIGAVLFFLAALSFVFVEYNVRPVLMAMAEKKAEVLATEALNDAIQESMAREVDYSDLIIREYGERGHIRLMYPNFFKINRIRTAIISTAQTKLKQYENYEFGIPLGQLLGSQLLAVYGPEVTAGFAPLGTVEVEVREEFQEAGINQTRHKIYLRAKAHMKVLIPFYRKTLVVSAEMPLVDGIIVGPIPETYLELKWGS